MEGQSLVIIEHHPISGGPPEQVIRQTVTAWLTKELHADGGAVRGCDKSFARSMHG